MCKGISKIFLVAINITFFVVGALLATLGGLAKFNQDLLLKLFDIIPGDVVDDIKDVWDFPAFLDSVGLIVMLVGICLFIIAFCGCCGGLKESKCLLVIYMIIVFVIFAGQLAAIILTYVKADEVEDAVTDVLDSSIQKYTNEAGGFDFDSSGNPMLATDATKLAWDTTQVLVGCCGVTNYTDYNFAGTYKLPGSVADTNAIIPVSCCTFISEDEYKLIRDEEDESVDGEDVDGAKRCLKTAASDDTRTTGCYTKVRADLENYQLIVALILGGIVLIEMIAFVSACCIIKLRDDDNTA